MIHFAEITAQVFKGRMGDPRAVRVRLADAGWDDVALAGISDVPWGQMLGLLRAAIGQRSFSAKPELRAALACRTTLLLPGFFKDTAWGRRYGEEAETFFAPLKEGTHSPVAVAFPEQSRSARRRRFKGKAGCKRKETGWCTCWQEP